MALRLVQVHRSIDDPKSLTSEQRRLMEFRAVTLLKAINDNLYAADFFTREDILHTPVFMHIATISRYQMVCRAVRWLIRTKRLTELSKTDLRVVGKNTRYHGPIFYEDYIDTIESLIREFKTTEEFTVMDIVNLWRSDPHLTTNNKRVAVRKSMTRLVNRDALTKLNEFEYVRK